MKIGNIEFGREQIVRIERVEEIYRDAVKVFPDSFKYFITYMEIFLYISASLDLINDRDNAAAYILREGLPASIADNDLLDYLDKEINKGDDAGL